MYGRHHLARVLAAAALLASAGCASLWHELQPWRLWRMNQTPARGNDAFYSVEDRP